MRIFPLTAALAALLLPWAGRADIVPENFDLTVKPQDDFFHFVNGAWIKTAQIPAAYGYWGVVNELRDKSQQDLKVLCERASAEGDQGTPIERLVGDFYASGMDADNMDAIGARPLRFEFDRIDAVKTPADVLAELAHLHSLGVDAGFQFSSAIDLKNSSRQIASAVQGGLGLPEPGYYLRPSDQPKRDKYVAHIAQMLILLGGRPETASAQAAAVLALETTLARSSRPPDRLRDLDQNHHIMTIAEAVAATPGLDWPAYFAQREAPAFTTFNMGQPEYFKALGQALTQTPVATWQIYLRWHFIHEYAAYLSSNFVKEDFSFYGTTLTGVTALKPQWQRVALTIDDEIGEALSQLYTAEYFPPESKARVVALVQNLRVALAERIKANPWMDEPTRAQALAKLAAFGVKIGYPDKWRDYRGLSIDRGAYVLNVLKAEAFNSRWRLGKIGQRVDPSEWSMTPATVNAYFSPLRNEIVFPAAILQKPFFDPQADDAVNYGAIGSIMGHEMTHGFDDQGRKFDAKGERVDWWSPASAAQFAERSVKIVQQYDDYVALPNLHVNGTLTEGENIADLGGLKIAYTALEKVLDTGTRTTIGGFTPEQRFFISYATTRRTVYRPEMLSILVRTNPHAPDQFRCNGPLSNLDEFYAAFSVPEGAPMRRSAAEQVSIW
jgi:putative endopeptidase